MKKKTGDKKKGVGKKSMLKEALGDLDRELVLLSKQKNSFNNQISGLDVSVGGARQLEKELQAKIARLLEKEAGLMEKKKDVQTNIDMVVDKLGKVRKIKEDLSNL